MKQWICVLLCVALTFGAWPVTKYATTGTAMDSDANTWGQVVAGGVVTHPVTNARLTPAVSPGWTVDALIGLYVEINLVLYTIADNDADWLEITVVGPSNNTYRWIVFNESPPGDGDTCNLNGAAVTMASTPFPASGTLAEITATTSAASPVVSAGYLTIPVNTLGNCTVNVTALNSGSRNGGTVILTGDATGYTVDFPVCMGGISAGASQGSHCLVISTTGTGTFNIAGPRNGGSGVASSGVVIGTGGTVMNAVVNLSGHTTGGSGRFSHGTYASYVHNGTVTLTNCNITNGTGGLGYACKAPVWVNDGSNYTQWAITEGAVKMGRQPTAANLATGIVCGDVTGTLDGEAHTASEVLTTASSPGNVVLPAEAEVQDSVTFGPSETLTGTYDNSTDPDYVISTQGGNFVVPPITKVEDQYTFGVDDALVGSLVCGTSAAFFNPLKGGGPLR